MGRKRKLKAGVTIPPNKDPEIEQKVRKFVERRLFHVTGHAKKRMENREVTILEILQVLKRYRRDAKHDEYKEYDSGGNQINRWSYAFKGKTLDKRTLRIAVSLITEQERSLLIVTVIDLDI